MLSDLVPILKRLRWVPERGKKSDERKCGKCGLWKRTSEFRNRGGDRAYQYRAWCNPCEVAYKRDKYNSRRV